MSDATDRSAAAAAAAVHGASWSSCLLRSSLLPPIAAFLNRCTLGRALFPRNVKIRSGYHEVTACAWAGFRRPFLRRSNLQDDLKFIKLLGYGVDGVVWQVEIGDRVVALNQALQRESQDASILQMVQLAVEHYGASI
ncbi:hypothetical protein L249_1935 [Ophiocordyceps polyrhachis-furcata BCC 54312]|uniref:Uncharacterized protein n=1 Tax=Ophiocordyceps polyrhachis-furcata BCC 54312 TaxID=1330021 RepID=A0A367LN60_9HYPO|nr:hypothetical protein L249_1935 [Ophiocordyceps polyrhachis-furcata BCC 54312]